MRKILKWLLRILAGLLGLVVALAVVIYVATAIMFGKVYEIPPSTFSLSVFETDTEEGRRIARTRGCYRGCHGDLDGAVFFDEPGIGRLVAPNLTAAARKYSDPELEQIIRHGVRPDGRSLIGMPSASFYHLSDLDLANILAFIRSEPYMENELPSSRIDVGARFFILLGEFPLEAAEIDHDAPRMVNAVDDPVASGEYLATTTCAECHGLDLNGNDFAPDLAIMGAYTREQFEHLIETGKGLGDRDVGLMGKMATGRFSKFNARERDALHAYLSQKPPKETADQGL